MSTSITLYWAFTSTQVSKLGLSLHVSLLLWNRGGLVNENSCSKDNSSHCAQFVVFRGAASSFNPYPNIHRRPEIIYFIKSKYVVLLQTPNQEHIQKCVSKGCFAVLAWTFFCSFFTPFSLCTYVEAFIPDLMLCFFGFSLYTTLKYSKSAFFQQQKSVPIGVKWLCGLVRCRWPDKRCHQTFLTPPWPPPAQA